MKKPASKIRDEIARLQEQLKQAETRDAERIGRIALKAGLGEIDIEEAELQGALEELARRFRKATVSSKGANQPAVQTAPVGSGLSAGQTTEA